MSIPASENGVLMVEHVFRRLTTRFRQILCCVQVFQKYILNIEQHDKNRDGGCRLCFCVYLCL